MRRTTREPGEGATRKTVYDARVARLTKKLRAVSKLRGPRSTVALAFFDLSGSTSMKLNDGHGTGTHAALLHSATCREVAALFKGRVVKNLGDGVICEFDDPLNACVSALNTRRLASSLGITTKAGLTIGPVERVTVDGTPDILGATVDRCARIQSIAVADQLVIDDALLKAVESFLRDFADIRVSKGADVDLKGIGTTRLYELTTADVGYGGRVDPFFGDDISPIQHDDYPDWTDPVRWLLCDVCGRPISTNPRAPDGLGMAMVGIYQKGKVISVRLHHKDRCQKDITYQWEELLDLTNPEIYVDFVLSLFWELSKGKRLANPESVKKVMLAFYRMVLRPSSEAHHLAFQERKRSPFG